VPTAAPGCKLLLVEDDASLRKVLARELHKMGHEVHARGAD
jgi:ActR/RegA family two-component response regulator